MRGFSLAFLSLFQFPPFDPFCYTLSNLPISVTIYILFQGRTVHFPEPKLPGRSPLFFSPYWHTIKMGSSHPDADNHPEATGDAAKWFSQHTSEQPLKLYSAWFCPSVIPFLVILLNPFPSLTGHLDSSNALSYSSTSKTYPSNTSK